MACVCLRGCGRHAPPAPQGLNRRQHPGKDEDGVGGHGYGAVPAHAPRHFRGVAALRVTKRVLGSGLLIGRGAVLVDVREVTDMRNQS